MNRDFDWDGLLENLEARRVVPIVGREASQVMLSEDGATSFESLVARRLAEIEGVGTGDLADLQWVAFEVARAGRNSARIYRAVRKVVRQLEDELVVPDSLKQLADISHFDLFVTTTFDSLLYRALLENRGAARQIAYGLRTSESVADLQSREPDTLRPTVYHVLGKAETIPNYAVTEEDHVEFLCALQGRNRPERLVSRLRESSLLILGCGFPEWLFRMFMRVLKDQPFTKRETEEFLADNEVAQERELVLFLSEYGAQVSPIVDVPAFIRELHGRWSDALGDARHCPGTSVSHSESPSRAPKVFLSYASEDREVVERVAAQLRGAGVEAWFDQRSIEFGDRWCRKIEEGLEECAAFVPFISRETERRQRGYFNFEWRLAERIQLQYAHHHRYFWPVLVDDVAKDSPHIPPSFREVQMCRLDGGRAPLGFVEALVSEMSHRTGGGA